MRRLYFAFGSNLNVQQLRGRCRDVEIIGPATLHDHELVFTGFARMRGGGVATVRPRFGAYVGGAIYVLGRAAWRALDHYEGVPSLYVRRPADVTVAAGGRVRVLLYVRARDELERTPSDEYLATILAGYRDFALDPTPLNDAIARAVLAQDPDR